MNAIDSGTATVPPLFTAPSTHLLGAGAAALVLLYVMGGIHERPDVYLKLKPTQIGVSARYLNSSNLDDLIWREYSQAESGTVGLMGPLAYIDKPVGELNGEPEVARALQALSLVATKEAQDLGSLLALQSNWDDEGGRPATQEAVTAAARVIAEVGALSTGKVMVVGIGAANDGGVHVTWKTRLGSQLLLVFPSSGGGIRYVLSRKAEGTGFQDSFGHLNQQNTLRVLVESLAI